MKSNHNLFELILTPTEICKLPEMPDSKALEQALGNTTCSELFPNGFSYKPLDLGVGIAAENDEEYRFIKQLKNARYIHDQAKKLPIETLINQLIAGALKIQNGYIGYNYASSLGFKVIRLSDSDKLFGIELRPQSLFRCFVKTENPIFPEYLTINGHTLKILQVNPLKQSGSDFGVLQSNMPIRISPEIAEDSESRFKLSYDANSECTVVCAGSVIHPNDYFGDGIII